MVVAFIITLAICSDITQLETIIMNVGEEVGIRCDRSVYIKLRFIEESSRDTTNINAITQE